MKKFLFAIIVICMSTVSYADCEGGSIFTGVNDGHEYCLSTASMPWWAAFVWCEHNGRRLASLQEACDEWNGAAGDVACANFVKAGMSTKGCWTASPDGDRWAYGVNVGNGRILNGNYPRSNSYCAICY